jgi:hypothetical protein
MTGDMLTVYMGVAFNSPAQIYVATRVSVADPFGPPVAVPELGSSFSDAPRWVSRDGCTLTFTRYKSAMDLDMFVAQRPL